MKALRPVFAMIGLILCLLFPPASSQSSLVYGSCVTAAFVGSISGTETNGTLRPGYYNLRSSSLLSNWSVNYITMTSMSTSVDSHLNYHSRVLANVFFSDNHISDEFAVSEADITIPVSGPQTIGLKVADYDHPATVLYTSGTNADGSIRQLPITAGGFEIEL